jgi:CubicO group peptidase (beta-lactamase class C family)
MEAGGRKSLVVAACVVAVAVAVVAGCSRTPPDVSTVTSEYEAAVAETPSLTEFRASGLSRADVEGLDALGSSLEMLRGNLHIAGMSAAVVRDQELVWAKGFGLADIEQGIPAAPNTPYCLASLTKPFASTLLLELVESGQLDLDEPVADHGIEYASPGTIRVKHLFSHTSAYWPGTRYHYSGDRYSELDHVLESVAGASFRALATERILDPLGLTDTTFGPLERAMVDGFLNFRESRVEPRAVLAPDGTEYEFGDIREDDPHIMTTIGVFETLVGSVVDTSLYDFRRVPPLPVDDASLESFAAFWASQERYEDAQSRIARPYSLNADLEPVPGRYSPNNSAAAGILSSVVDLARYDAALDWNLLVGRDTQDLAFEPTVSADGDTLPYGFGWFVQRFGGKKLLWHYGYWDCASTLIVKVPEEEITFVLLANTDALSRTTAGIGMRGDVLVSPAASLFLRHLVFAPDGDPVHLDWNAPLGSLSETLASSTDPLERELLERELGAAAYVAAIGELGVRTPEELCGAADDAWSEPFVPTVDLPVVALVENVGNDDLKSEAFTLDAPRRLRVYAVGEGGRGGMYDFAWIEDTDTGGRVWFMNWPETEDAGGSGKNRKIDESFVLPAGRYALRFRADDSHAYKSWNAVPPSDGFWGAIVWDDGPAEYIDATTWEHAADPEALGWSAAGLDTVAAMLRRAGSAAFLVATDGKLVYEYGTTTLHPRGRHVARSDARRTRDRRLATAHGDRGVGAAGAPPAGAVGRVHSRAGRDTGDGRATAGARKPRPGDVLVLQQLGLQRAGNDLHPRDRGGDRRGVRSSDRATDRDGALRARPRDLHVRPRQHGAPAVRVPHVGERPRPVRSAVPAGRGVGRARGNPRRVGQGEHAQVLRLGGLPRDRVRVHVVDPRRGRGGDGVARRDVPRGGIRLTIPPRHPRDQHRGRPLLEHVRGGSGARRRPRRVRDRAQADRGEVGVERAPRPPVTPAQLTTECPGHKARAS